MKKQLSLFVWAAAVFGVSAVLATDATASGVVVQNNIVTAQPVEPPPREVVTVRVREPERYYDVEGPRGECCRQEPCCAPVRAGVYDGYDGCRKRCAPAPMPVPVREYAAPPPPPPPPVQEKQPEPKPQRVYGWEHLADPFFQPRRGRFGSVTDLGWARNSYDFTINNIASNIITGSGGFYEGIEGEWVADEIFLKQDLSYGITNTIAVIGSVKYGWNDYSMNWKDPAIENDNNSESGFNQWGVGLQWKFVDETDWVGYIAGFYQWNKIANAILADTKLGYKVGGTTVYGLGRLWSIGWEDNSYGNGIVADTGQVTYFALKRDVSRSLLLEGGVGLFAELSKEWSINADLIFGDYEWHSQANVGAAIFFQPMQNFAIGVYGRASIWDNASSNENIGAWGWYPAAGIGLTYIGAVQIENYSDMAVGAKMLLYF